MHYRWTRRATVAAAGAREFAAMVTDYVNEKHGLSVSWGMQIMGEGDIYWYADYDSLAAYEQAVGSIMSDAEYSGKILPQGAGLFVPGSQHDSMVLMM